jgi:acyl-CoA dehydrogenase
MKRKIFTAEHELFRETVRKFIDREVLPSYERWQREHQVPREVWLRAGQEGLLCPTAEPEYGGLGADFLYGCVITEELYRQAVPCFFLPLHSEIVFPYLARLATPEQKRRWIPGCITGEHILALAMTEPSAGSDLAALATRAVRDGDDYVVNGSKTFISNGQIADLFVVAVRTDPRASRSRGISLLVIEADRPGFQRGRNLEKIGFHAQDTSEIFFDDCRVPACNLLGVENAGFGCLMENLQQERLVLAAGACAAAEGCLALTVDYVKQRRAFNKALSELQHVRFELAELATKVQLARTFLDELFLRHMAGEHLVREVSMAKWWITDVQFEVADRCLQLFGGYGYMTEYPVSRHFVDARIQRIYGGANEIMKELIARQIGLDS